MADVESRAWVQLSISGVSFLIAKQWVKGVEYITQDLLALDNTRGGCTWLSAQPRSIPLFALTQDLQLQPVSDSVFAAVLDVKGVAFAVAADEVDTWSPNNDMTVYRVPDCMLNNASLLVGYVLQESNLLFVINPVELHQSLIRQLRSKENVQPLVKSG